MTTEINAVQFEQDPKSALAKVALRHDSVVINQDGRPVAALVNMETFARMERIGRRFDAMRAKLAAGFADVSPEEGEAMVLALVMQERGK